MGSQREELFMVMAIFLVLNTVAVFARLYTRIFLVKAYGIDDFFLTMSFAGFILACGFGWVSMHYGFAADITEAQPWFNVVRMTEAYLTNQTILYLSSGLVKVAVCIILYRMAPNAFSQVLIIIVSVVVILWTSLTTGIATNVCVRNGFVNYIGSSLCISVGYFRIIGEIVIDYFLALYPILMLWHSSLTTRMKIIICGLLSLGLVASTATIPKLIILVRMTQTSAAYEITWDHYNLLMWADVELALSILAASCAGLRPLIRKILGRPSPNVISVRRGPSHAQHCVSMGSLPQPATTCNLLTLAGDLGKQTKKPVSIEHQLTTFNACPRAESAAI